MGNTYSEKVERQLELLKQEVANGEIAESDSEAIQSFIRNKRGSKAQSTLKNYLTYLRTIPKRSDIPLTEMTVKDIENLLNSLRDGSHPEVKDDGIGVSNYQKTLRVFYRYHDDLGIVPEDIEIDQQPGRNLNADALLFRRDVDAMLRACRNLRNRALITLMLATGQRLDAVRTLRLKHLQSDGRTMEIQLNEEEGALKGANGTRPLLWSKHYVRDWYENHPHRDNPEAALFCPFPDRVGQNEPASEEGEPLQGQTIRDIINRIADRAGLEKNVYPHLFRHTAITRMVLEEIHPQNIKRMVGWTGDSDQFETYVSLADDMNNDALREAHGLPTSDEGIPVIGRPTLERCPECNDELPEGSETCLSCNQPLTHAAAEAEEESEEPDNPIKAALQTAFEENEKEDAQNMFVEAIQDVAEDLDSGNLQPD